MVGMIELVAGSAGVLIEVDRDLTYTEVEAALQGQGSVPLVRWVIDLTPLGDRTRVHINAHLRVEAITADGVPTVPALPVLQALTAALAALDR
jgi:hypothetical protein